MKIDPPKRAGVGCRFSVCPVLDARHQGSKLLVTAAKGLLNVVRQPKDGGEAARAVSPFLFARAGQAFSLSAPVPIYWRESCALDIAGACCQESDCAWRGVSSCPIKRAG